MRIGVYFGRHGTGGGMKTFALAYIYELLNSLEQPSYRDLEFVFYGDRSVFSEDVLDDLSIAQILTAKAKGALDFGGRQAFRPLPNGERCRVFTRILPGIFGRRLNGILDQLLLGLYCRLDGVEFLHSTSNFGSFWRNPPQLVTVHDLFQAFPAGAGPREPKTPWVRGREWLYRLLFAIQFRVIAQAVTDAESVAQEISGRYNFDRARLRVIPLGLDPVFSEYLSRPQSERPRNTAFPLPARVVLAFASVDPRKNLARTLDAWKLLTPAERGDAKLAVLLADPRAKRFVEANLKTELASGQAIILPRMRRGDLPSVIAQSEVVLLPTLREGFGLPAYEALALGRRVVSPRLEFFGEFPPELVFECDAQRPEDIRRALRAALDDGEGALPKAGRAMPRRRTGGVPQIRTLRQTVGDYLQHYRQFATRSLRR